MQRLSATLIVLVSLLPLALLKAGPQDPVESEAITRIARLYRNFGNLSELTPSEKQWMEACSHGHRGCESASPEIHQESERARRERNRAIDRLASRIHCELDWYIARSVRPHPVDPGKLARNLEHILGKTTWGSVSVLALDADSRPSLAVAYSLAKGDRMGKGATSVTIRLYRATQGIFHRVAATGREMDGYRKVPIVELHSPVSGELWLLVSGYLTGANGPNNEIRVYAYDGAKFRTVWKDDAWGVFNVRVTDRGFLLTGSYYPRDTPRNDAYTLAEDGIHRLCAPPRSPRLRENHFKKIKKIIPNKYQHFPKNKRRFP